MKFMNDNGVAKKLFGEDVDVQHINGSRVQTSYLEEETQKNNDNDLQSVGADSSAGSPTEKRDIINF